MEAKKIRESNTVMDTAEPPKIKKRSDALALLDQVIQANYDYINRLNTVLETLREAVAQEVV